MTWAEEQVRALMNAGLTIEDAQSTVGWVLANVPAGEESTWIPVADLLVDRLDHAEAQDARAAWYAQAPAEFKRILDAVDETAGDG